MDELGDQLAGWGKVIRLRTRGRVTGRDVEVALGFVAEPDGSLLVAAGLADADWARNLDADPRATITLGDETWEATAEPLDRAGLQHAVRELILRYGTPAERLGAGPAYRLRRLPGG